MIDEQRNPLHILKVACVLNRFGVEESLGPLCDNTPHWTLQSFVYELGPSRGWTVSSTTECWQSH